MRNNEQLSLNLGGGSPKAPKTKVVWERRQALYFAALPNPEIAELTAELTWDQSRRNGLTREPRQHDLYHTTIYPIDIVSRSREEAIFAAMEAASTINMSSFPLTYDRVTTFGGDGNHQYVLWCRRGNAELRTLRRELDAALQNIGFESDVSEAFEPHMTLFYCRRVLPEVMLERPITSIVKNFTLVNSFQGDREHGHIWQWSLF